MNKIKFLGNLNIKLKIFFKKNIWKIGKYLFFLFLGIIFIIFLLFFYYTWDLPRPEKFTESPFIQSTKIYDRTGKVILYDIYGEEKRQIVSFDKISDYLKYAVLSNEDPRFYKHNGIDFRGILRALFIDITSKSKSQGGSTITQQLVRFTYLTGQKTISRKIREIVLSIELEQKYSKDQIFEWYLNGIPFGENAYGAEAASQTYFNKPATDLTLAEAATLAALIPAPSFYSPYGPNKTKLLEKKDIILDKMEKNGYISAEQKKEAKEEKISFQETKISIKAPHFVLYVKKYLDNKYGEDYLKEKGLKVYTSLDYELQEYAEKIITDNETILKNKGANNAAMVVLDPKTGEILALVGSKNWFAKPFPEGCDEKGPGVCLFDPKYDVATMGERQPGSAFKPLVYATAFKKGFTPDTILWDVKTEFNPNCDPGGENIISPNGQLCYHPQNYDGTYRGPVTMRQALSGSLNVPAVKTLYLAGIPDSIKTAQDMGITTLRDTQNYGLSLVLGGGAVNLLQLTSAYGVFASDGNYLPPVSILKITDADGNIIEENQTRPTKVLDTQIARQINSILSDNDSRTPIFGANSPLYFPGYQVAAKTGTTQFFIDGWTMGYTPSTVVGVWIGNNNNTPTTDIGIGTAAPIWNQMMKKILATRPVENFIPPDPITDRNPVLLGQLPKNDINTILYYIDKNNPLGPPPNNPSSDPQYFMWQTAIYKWLINTGQIINNENSETL